MVAFRGIPRNVMTRQNDLRFLFFSRTAAFQPTPTRQAQHANC